MKKTLLNLASISMLAVSANAVDFEPEILMGVNYNKFKLDYPSNTGYNVSKDKTALYGLTLGLGYNIIIADSFFLGHYITTTKYLNKYKAHVGKKYLGFRIDYELSAYDISLGIKPGIKSNHLRVYFPIEYKRLYTTSKLKANGGSEKHKQNLNGFGLGFGVGYSLIENLDLNFEIKYNQFNHDASKKAPFDDISVISAGVAARASYRF